MRAIFIFFLLLIPSFVIAQDDQEPDGPSDEVLIAASEIGNGRASLLLSERYADQDPDLSGFYAALAFKEFTVGASNALLNNFEDKGELIEFQPNARLGVMVLRAYLEHPEFSGDLPPQTSPLRLPHAAFVLTRMGYYEGEIPEVGAELDEALALEILEAMHTALQTADVRGRVERGITRMANQLTCNREEQACS